MVKRTLIVMISAALSAAGCSGTRKSALDREIQPRYVAESGANELLSVCAALNMPCGWELIPSDAGRLSQAVENAGETGPARRFLEALVQRHPVYRWFLTSDKKVLNVAPRRTGANDPLDRQVWVDLQNVPTTQALKELVASAGLKLVAPPRPLETVYGLALSPGRVTLKAQGLRLRIALNRLVELDGRSMWWCAPVEDPDAVRCDVPTWREGRPQ